MNEDWSISCDHVEVVVVVAGDGEVPHPAVMLGRDRPADDDRGLAVRRLEVHARFELFCRNPAVVRIRIPEQVAGGGADDGGAAAGFDGEVVEVGVVVDEDGGDASGWVVPVFVLVARTLSPGLSWLMGIAAPEASRTLVPAEKELPPVRHFLARESPNSASPLSAATIPSAAAPSSPTPGIRKGPTSLPTL
jgi:hypothetical protein